MSQHGKGGVGGEKWAAEYIYKQKQQQVSKRIPFDIIFAVFFRHADLCCKKESITGILTQILGQCPGCGVTMPRNNTG